MGTTNAVSTSPPIVSLQGQQTLVPSTHPPPRPPAPPHGVHVPKAEFIKYQEDVRGGGDGGAGTDDGWGQSMTFGDRRRAGKHTRRQIMR